MPLFQLHEGAKSTPLLQPQEGAKPMPITQPLPARSGPPLVASPGGVHAHASRGCQTHAYHPALVAGHLNAPGKGTNTLLLFGSRRWRCPRFPSRTRKDHVYASPLAPRRGHALASPPPLGGDHARPTPPAPRGGIPTPLQATVAFPSSASRLLHLQEGSVPTLHEGAKPTPTTQL